MKTRVLALCGFGAVVCSANAYAINDLQLSIIDGYYNSGTTTATCDTKSTCTGDLFFPLTAYLKGDLSAAGDFFISAAVFPAIDEPGADLGSFDFNGATINVTGDMTYGTPPLAELCSGNDCLGTHGIYDTYYIEIPFQFTSSLIDAVDISAGAGVGFDPTTASACSSAFSQPQNCMYYEVFDVDVSSLSPDYSIHFDLYSKNPDGTYDLKAPFSHDAQSGPGGGGGALPPDVVVPEIDALASTGALTLLAGVLALAGERRRRKASH